MTRTLTVLVVEDDELGARTLASLLTADGHTSEVAHNGRQAIERLRVGSFDLLITDIYMPDMDGIELLRTLRHRAEPLPIIAISGGGRTVQVDYLDLAQRLGAHQVLRKPFTRRVLRAAIRAVMGDDCMPTDAGSAPASDPTTAGAAPSDTPSPTPAQPVDPTASGPEPLAAAPLSPSAARPASPAPTPPARHPPHRTDPPKGELSDPSAG